ncbi:gamma-glutamylcyclotransferase family protein [Ostreiculturibacter nitratireducens]|uniref:gamma-glutamylcyclotransferase family protein n=1 Tax=Ostreiculturibacter nitratireducens TaxID=3075226 RepID=UPI0031B5F748
MKHPAFFGYGSLVNRETHDYAPATPARLTGWRRVWRHTGLRPLAFLSVEPAENVTIDGLVAAVPGDDWTALDKREGAYDRHHLPSTTVAHEAHWASSVQVYAVSSRHRPADETHPVLLSYIDTVVQGFLREFGEEGAQRFFDTTAGWETPILDDRAAPRYSRARALSLSETAFVDEALIGVGAQRLR